MCNIGRGPAIGGRDARPQRQARQPLELTLESAFSTGGMVGHLSYLLLVVSMLMRSMTKLRVIVIASSLTAIAYDVIWLKDPVGVFWESLLVSVNIVQLILIWQGNRRSQFTDEEAALIKARLPGLLPKDARRLLDYGMWTDSEPGTELTLEGERVKHLCYLSAGRVEITSDGRTVGFCHPGNFVGEMSIVGGDPASATAQVAEPSRLWMIPTAKIRELQEADDMVVASLGAGIARDLRRKILTSNTMVKSAAADTPETPGS